MCVCVPLPAVYTPCLVFKLYYLEPLYSEKTVCWQILTAVEQVKSITIKLFNCQPKNNSKNEILLCYQPVLIFYLLFWSCRRCMWGLAPLHFHQTWVGGKHKFVSESKLRRKSLKVRTGKVWITPAAERSGDNVLVNYNTERSGFFLTTWETLQYYIRVSNFSNTHQSRIEGLASAELQLFSRFQ